MTFSEILTSERTKYGYSQRALGEALEISQQAVNNWESGKNEPAIEMLIRVSSFFNVSVGYMLGVEAPEKRPSEVENIYNNLNAPHRAMLLGYAMRLEEEERPKSKLAKV